MPMHSGWSLLQRALGWRRAPRRPRRSAVTPIAAALQTLEPRRLLNGNQPPVISPQTFAVSENRSVGHVIGTVVASDPDPGQSLAYSIVSGNTNSVFALNAATGLFTVAKAAIDFETQSQYQLLVQVTDNGSPASTRSALVTVNITNLNEAPTFLQPTTFTLSENRPVGQLVGTVKTVDPEMNAVTYSITGGDPNAQFAINATTGQLTVAKATIDFEVKSQYVLQVKAQDNGFPPNSRTQNVTVNIANLNEAPV
ncbi:MAG TPA: cadherin repeat domain-containing protein, partial [Planctomycetaceae bacterium]|nr:cadherin repeat domain-containing protein [Planctomycetaceae bacterium]